MLIAATAPPLRPDVVGLFDVAPSSEVPEGEGLDTVAADGVEVAVAREVVAAVEDNDEEVEEDVVDDDVEARVLDAEVLVMSGTVKVWIELEVALGDKVDVTVNVIGPVRVSERPALESRSRLREKPRAAGKCTARSSGMDKE